MAKKAQKPIPVNAMTDDRDSGITIEKVTFSHLPPVNNGMVIEDDRQAHRHNTHTFHLLEKGTVQLEIDFEHYSMGPSSVVYIRVVATG